MVAVNSIEFGMVKAELCLDFLIDRGVCYFAYQWLKNVKTNKYAKFDNNLPCGPRVMSILLIDHNLLK